MWYVLAFAISATWVHVLSQTLGFRGRSIFVREDRERETSETSGDHPGIQRGSIFSPIDRGKSRGKSWNIWEKIMWKISPLKNWGLLFFLNGKFNEINGKNLIAKFDWYHWCCNNSTVCLLSHNRVFFNTNNGYIEYVSMETENLSFKNPTKNKRISWNALRNHGLGKSLKNWRNGSVFFVALNLIV